MSWSFRIARILGTDVKIHVTFVLLLVFFFARWQQEAGTQAAVAATILSVAVFLCVLLHEFGHILMARRFGIRTPDVILLPIGGVARLERIPEEPRQEFLIAVAGPAVTLAIALGLYVLVTALGEQWSFAEGDPRLLVQLGNINGLLLLFNLIPAFPLDGGRVLRSLLASRLAYPRATRIAATVGQGFAMVGGVYGYVRGPWVLMFIAVFVFFGATQEARIVEQRSAARALTVSRVMITRFLTLPLQAPLRHAVDLLGETDQREFPVVGADGRLVGLLTRENLVIGLTERGADSTVEEAMDRAVTPLPVSMSFDAALAQLRSSGLPALPVVDAEGCPTGLLTVASVADLVMVPDPQ